MANNELSKIIDLTPNYYRWDRDYREYGRPAWNKFLVASELFYNFIKEHSEIAAQWGNNIQLTIDAIYNKKLSEGSKENMAKLIKKKVSQDSLSKENFDPSDYTYPDLYHGTGSQALNGIFKYGELLSEAKLQGLAIKVLTGERYWQVKRWLNDSISLTISPDIALDPHAYIDGISCFQDYPVVLGFAEERVNKTSWNDYDPEPGEICVKGRLPIETATHLFAPSKQIVELRYFIDKYNLNAVPLEALQTRCSSSNLGVTTGVN
ncbi:MAG: hypothetical protein PHH54_06395 [Candidatus Nanoarchaeia archaeon]|nr:hypothetical protein [Candidatus Nanoarchaeia archaeon]MDD5741585.1 hypothetical protein [Candidatus Nanoarchaeia archaeon]